MRNHYFVAILLCLFSSFGQLLLGQNNTSVIPRYPNAAAMAKYGDIPVNTYSGLPSVSIPLYTVVNGDIQVPISLSYHASGIRLNEQAGWVGLGWVLNAGGMITREVKGKDDFVDGHIDTYYPGPVPELVTNSVMTKYTDVLLAGNPALGYFPYLYDMAGNTYDMSTYLAGSAGFDMQYDNFTFNFLGRSGRFIISRSGKVVLEKMEDLEITFANNHAFKIKDEHGFIYDFSTMESAFVNSSDYYITSWYLSKITSPLGNIVDFTYEEDAQPPSNYTNDLYRSGCTCHLPTGSKTDPESYNLTTSTSLYGYAAVLKRIDYGIYHVDFPNDNNRIDYSGHKINGLQVFSSGSTPIKSFDFGYTYFNNDIVSPKQYKRLKLASVTERSAAIINPPYVFTYVESLPNLITSLTDINSFSIDHWGYYNGQTNTSLRPDFNGYVNSSGASLFTSIPGGNRETDANSVKLFSLSEIKYPTGGKTVFDMEPHDYDPQASPKDIPTGSGTTLQPAADFQTISANGTTSITKNLSNVYGAVTMTVTFRYSNSFTDAKNHYGYGQDGLITVALPNSSNITWESSGLTCSNNEQVCTMSFSLPVNSSGNYSLSYSAYIDPSITTQYFQDITVKFSYYQYKTSQTNFPNLKYLIGGGLRIKELTNYDENGAIVTRKKYDYHYQADKDNDGTPETYSYGMKLHPLVYSRNEIVQMTSNDGAAHYYSSCLSYDLSGSGVTSSQTVVGYNQVTEYILNNTGTTSLGKTEYYFENNHEQLVSFDIPSNGSGRGGVPTYSDLRPPGAGSLAYGTNGNLIKKVDYKLNGSVYTPVLEVSNDYLYPLINNYYGILSELFTFQLLSTEGTTVVIVYLYPAFRSEKVRLAKTTQVSYDQQNTTLFSKTETTYEYSDIHSQLKGKTITDSKGERITEKMVYPPDYGTLATATAGIKNLQDKHIYGAVIEKYQTVKNADGTGNRITSGMLTTYQTMIPQPDQVSILDVSTPLNIFNSSDNTANSFSPDTRYQSRVQYNKYDTRGNLLMMTKPDRVPVSYLWGYDNKYPIVEIKNAVNNITYTTQTVQSTGSVQVTMGTNYYTTSATKSVTVDYTGPIKIKMGIPGSPAYTTTFNYSGAGYSGSITLTNGQSCGYNVITIPNVAPGSYSFTFTITASDQNVASIGACGSIEYPQNTQQTTSTGAIEFYYEGFEYSSITGIVNDKTKAHSGNTYYGGDFQPSFAIPNSRGYIIEYWYMDSSNQWHLVRKPYTGTTNLTEGVAIDEVRIYPEGAFMTTYTYDPLIGMTTSTDANNVTVYYEYDNFQRLKLVKDQNGKIIKEYKYHYIGQTGDL